MNLMSNFKMPKFEVPKIDTDILPSASDFGIDTGKVNGAINDISSKLDLKGSIDLTRYPNPKDKALALVNSIPSFGHFSLTSLIPNSFYDKIDTVKIQNDLNGFLSGTFDLGGLGTFKVPDNITDVLGNIASSSDLDFDSLYSMASFDMPKVTQVGSDFNLDELTAEMDQITSIASNEFDMSSYLNEFSNISL